MKHCTEISKVASENEVREKQLILPIFQNSYNFYFEKLQHIEAMEQDMTFGRDGSMYVKMCLLLS